MNGSQLISLLTGQISNQASAIGGAKGIAPGGQANGLSGEPPEGGFQSLLDGLLVQSADGGLTLDFDAIDANGIPGNGVASAESSASIIAFLANQANGNQANGNGNTNAIDNVLVPALPTHSVAPGSISKALASASPTAIETALALNAGTGNSDSPNPVAPEIAPEGSINPVLSKLAGEIALGVDNVGTGTAIESTADNLANAAAPAAANQISDADPQSDATKVVGHVADKPDGKATRSAGAAHANAAAVTAVLATAAAAAHNPVFGNVTSDAPAPASADAQTSQAPVVAPATTTPASTDTAANGKGQSADGQGRGQDNPANGQNNDQSAGQNADQDTSRGNAGDNGKNNDDHRGRRSIGLASFGNGPDRAGPPVIDTVIGKANGQASEIIGTIPNFTVARAGVVGVTPPAIQLDLAASSDIFFPAQHAASASASPAGISAFPTPASLAAASAQQDAPSFVRNSNFVASQVGLQISKAIADGENTFKLTLNPPELGRVEARLEFSGDRVVKAHIVAENRETLNLLQRDAHILEKALSESGLRTDSGSLSFSLKQQDNGDSHPALGHGAGHAADSDGDDFAADAIDVTEAIVTQMISDSAVDITV